MRVAITGASGLIGGALRARLRAEGHEVTSITRSREAARKPDVVHWDPAHGTIDARGLEGHDAVVHLAAESLFALWTDAKKRRIRSSRIDGTTLLSRTLAGLERKPAVLVSASAIGYYGDREEPVDESAAPGTGFLPDLAVAWEAATGPAEAAGIRVVHARQGVVLTPAGGMLRLILPLFRVGLGGRVGSGRNPFPWISLEDDVAALLHAVAADELRGPVNFVAPHVPTFGELVETLGGVLRRPTIFNVPAAAARLVAAEMADEMILVGARVVPERLRETRFRWRHERLEEALRAML